MARIRASFIRKKHIHNFKLGVKNYIEKFLYSRFLRNVHKRDCYGISPRNTKNNRNYIIKLYCFHHFALLVSSNAHLFECQINLNCTLLLTFEKSNDLMAIVP